MIDASSSVPDLNAGKDKWMMRILIVAGVGLAIGGGFVAYKFLTHEAGGAACARLDEIEKTDPRGAHAAVEYLVGYVESNITTLDRDRITINAEGNHDRCVASLANVEKVLTHGMFTRAVDCIAKLEDPRKITFCL